MPRKVIHRIGTDILTVIKWPFRGNPSNRYGYTGHYQMAMLTLVLTPTPTLSAVAVDVIDSHFTVFIEIYE